MNAKTLSERWGYYLAVSENHRGATLEICLLKAGSKVEGHFNFFSPPTAANAYLSTIKKYEG